MASNNFLWSNESNDEGVPNFDDEADNIIESETLPKKSSERYVQVYDAYQNWKSENKKLPRLRLGRQLHAVAKLQRSPLVPKSTISSEKLEKIAQKTLNYSFPKENDKSWKV